MLKKKTQYSDIPFFISKNYFTGDINLVKDNNAIKQSLKNLVLTIRGERPFRYVLGGNPREFLFDQFDAKVSLECKLLIANVINTYEPRVSLIDVAIEFSRINPNRINIIVVFRYSQTQASDSITISLERTR